MKVLKHFRTTKAAARLRVALMPLILMTFFADAEAVDRYHSSTLKWVYALSNGDFVLGFDVDSPYCNGFGGTPKYMNVAVGQNGVSSDGAKKIYGAALLAFATGKRLDIGFDDATTGCYISRVTVTN